ncbi:hypothetical protein, partial [Rhodoferax sp.]|uniref:hypothetical protein n=1 Tax=Rhodoferax sp. TaxID=50421 RepID=UPI0039B9603A
MLWIGLSVAPLLAHACPATLPAGLSGASVGQDLITNGLAMSITQVEGRETVNELLNRAEKTWTAAGFKVKRNHAAGWGIVSALSGQCLATLQL